MPTGAKLTMRTVDRTTADSLHLQITVDGVDGAVRRHVSLTNESTRAHFVDWLPYCGDLVWLLWRTGDSLSTPLYNASRNHPCSLQPFGHTLLAGEKFEAPEWQVVTPAEKFIGDSIPAGTYTLGVLLGITGMPSVVWLGNVEFVRP